MSSGLTAVVQGPLPHEFDIRYSADELRRQFPGITVFLATGDKPERGIVAPYADSFDRVFESADAGWLPPLKYADGKPNNVNRQLLSVREALAQVTTPYAMRLRTDATLMSPRVLEFWERTEGRGPSPRRVGQGRIITSSIFSINPRFDERMAYHLSDMFQFGHTTDLVRYYGAPPYTFEDATWYERNPYSPDTLVKERAFRSRLAPEQWMCLNYLFPDAHPIRFHNDISAAIIAEFEEYLVDNFVVVHPRDISLRMPRFQHALDITYYSALCYSFNDWQNLFVQLRGGERADLEVEVRWPNTQEDKAKYVRRISSPLILAASKRFPPGLRRWLARR